MYLLATIVRYNSIVGPEVRQVRLELAADQRTGRIELRSGQSLPVVSFADKDGIGASWPMPPHSFRFYLTPDQVAALALASDEHLYLALSAE